MDRKFEEILPIRKEEKNGKIKGPNCPYVMRKNDQPPSNVFDKSSTQSDGSWVHVEHSDCEDNKSK